MTFRTVSGTAVHDNHVNALIDAERGWGVVNGLATTPSGTLGLAVQVATGSYAIDGITRVNSSTTTINLTAADSSNPRDDLIYASGGTITKQDGTAAASPSVPIIPASGIPIAIVRVAANAGSIVAANITDHRVNLPTIWAPNLAGYHFLTGTADVSIAGSVGYFVSAVQEGGYAGAGGNDAKVYVHTVIDGGSYLTPSASVSQSVANQFAVEMVNVGAMYFRSGVSIAFSASGTNADAGMTRRNRWGLWIV